MDTIKWDDIERSDEADDFDFLDGLLQVKSSDIKAWQAQPDAVFRLIRTALRSGEIRYSVGDKIR